MISLPNLLVYLKPRINTFSMGLRIEARWILPNVLMNLVNEIHLEKSIDGRSYYLIHAEVVNSKRHMSYNDDFVFSDKVSYRLKVLTKSGLELYGCPTAISNN